MGFSSQVGGGRAHGGGRSLSPPHAHSLGPDIRARAGLHRGLVHASGHAAAGPGQAGGGGAAVHRGTGGPARAARRGEARAGRHPRQAAAHRRLLAGLPEEVREAVAQLSRQVDPLRVHSEDLRVEGR